MAEEIKKKEEAELREYEKKSFAARAIVAAGTMILSGIIGYMTGRIRRSL